MNSELSRRSVLVVGALALVDSTLTGCATSSTQAQAPASAQAPAGDHKGGDGHSVKTRTASCNCGQLRVTCTGPDPERISMCHCNLCQKQSGSVFAVQARFPKEQVKIEGRSTAWKFPIEGAQPVAYRNCASSGGTFHFCPVCGSTVYYTADADDARIGVKVGAFADPTFPPPKISGFEAYRHPWAMTAASVSMQHVD